jgi:hypothetical protein
MLSWSLLRKGLVRSYFLVLAKVKVVRKILSIGLCRSFSIKQAGVQRVRLTKRALDAGESARFSDIFFALAFLSSDGVPPPAPAQVTQPVGR